MPLAFHLMLNQLENPKGEAIVKLGDQCNQLLDRTSLPEQHLKDAIDFGTHADQGVQRGSTFDFADNLNRGTSGFHLQIVLTDNTDHAVGLHYHEKPDTMTAHF